MFINGSTELAPVTEAAVINEKLSNRSTYLHAYFSFPNIPRKNEVEEL